MDSAPCVSSQKLWITVDTQQQNFRGWIEFSCTIDKTTNSIGILAHSLDVSHVLVDGCTVSHSLRYPTVNSIPESWKVGEVKDAARKTAKLTYLQHKHLVDFQKQPNIVVEVPDSSSVDERQASGSEKFRDVVVQVLFSGKESCPLRVEEGFVCCQGAIQDSCPWIPCLTISDKQSTFDMEIAVRPDELAVCSGSLIGHEWSEGWKWKIFKYKVAPSPATNLFFAVGPFDLAPCSLEAQLGASQVSSPTLQPPNQSPAITHFSTKGSLKQLEATMRFFPFVFKHIEEVLGTSFPLPSIQNIFLPDFHGLTRSWHSCCIYSADSLLPDKPVASQTLESQLMIARGIASQWFGAILMPKSSSDLWVMEGLVGWLEGRFISKVMGSNEWNYRLAKKRKAVAVGEDGTWPPLCPRGSSTGVAGYEWVGHQQHLQWKATSVMCMLEKRVGSEVFRRVVERLISCAAHAVRSGLCTSARFLSTHSFLKEVGQSGGIRKEIQAFAERWIYGRGCPILKAAVTFDPKGFVDMKLRQQGSAACRDSTVRAMGISKDGGMGVLKVMVAESSMNCEHTMRIGSESMLEERFKVHGRPRKRKRSENDALDEEPLCPVKYVRVDPDGEWLANVIVDQSEAMWCNMLEEVKDVVAESEAVAGLACVQPSTMTVLNVLKKYLESEAFCCIRMEAALALGHSVCEGSDMTPVSFLIQYLKSRCYDPDLNLPKQNYFADFGEHMVNQSIPYALARSRNADGVTPQTALDVLLEVLDHNDNDGNEFDDADWIGAFLEALGDVKVKEKEEFEKIEQRIDRYLARDMLFPSPNGSVTQACLWSLVTLSLHKNVSYRQALLSRLQHYCCPNHPPRVRETAQKGSLQVRISLYGPDIALLHVMSCTDTSPSVLYGLVQEAISLITKLGKKARSKNGVSASTLNKLYAQMASHDDEAVRHLSFSLLMSIFGEPATLYRDKTQEKLLLDGHDSVQESKDVDSGAIPAASSSQSPGTAKAGNLKVKIKLKTFSLKNPS